jgi:tetratricopeptide (TPR) repeat protein
MIDRRRAQTIALIIIAFFTLLSVSAHAASRVAVIAVDGEDAPELVPLVEIGLDKSGMTLVDRTHLNEIVREQKLQILLSADSSGARAKLGQLLHADFLVFISCPDTPTRRLEVMTCETTQGIRLARTILPRADSAENDADAANQAITKAIAKSAKSGLKLIAVAPWSSDDLTTQFDYRREAFRRLVEAPLADRDDLVLVEFAEAEALKTELAIAGQPNLVRKQPLILSGKMKHSALTPDAQVTVSLELTRGGQTLGSWSSGQVDVSLAAARLREAATDLVNKAAGANSTTPLKLQARELGDRGDALLKLSFYADAAEMYEAALLLDPNNLADHAGAMRALSSQSRQEYALAEHGSDDPDARAKAASEVGPACASRATRCLQHMEFFLEHTTLGSWQVCLDYQACIPFFSGKEDMRELNYNVLKYKRDHGVKDGYRYMLGAFIRGSTSSATSPQAVNDDDAHYLNRLFDVCPEQSDILAIVENYGSNPARLQSILSLMGQSDNPVAVSSARQIRANLAATGNINGFKWGKPDSPTTPIPVVADIKPDFHTVPFTLPVKCTGFHGPAGPHADLLYTQNVHGTNEDCAASYVRDDGAVKSLGLYINGEGPVFDGKYVWWCSMQDGAVVLKAYDPAQDKIWTAGAAQGVPPDQANWVSLVGDSPGKAYAVGSIGADQVYSEPTRTWILEATMDPVAGPTCKMVFECRQRIEMGHRAPARCAFSPAQMWLYPGLPGMGKRATPHLYIFRREYGGMLAIELQTGRATVIYDDNRQFTGVYLNGKFYRTDMSVWDIRTNTTTQNPMPPGFAKPTKEHGVGVMNYNGRICYGVFVKSTAYFWFPDDKTQNNPLAGRIVGQQNGLEQLGCGFYCSGVFGWLVGDQQVQFLSSVPGLDYHAMEWNAFMQMHLAEANDPDSYMILVKREAYHSDKWLSALETYFKHAPPTLKDAQLAVETAYFLMRKGDYQRATGFSAIAARSGAEWAIQSEIYTAEGVGDWPAAEKFCRQAADSYGNTMEWFIWCTRTGHGDIAAARKQMADSLHPDSDDREDLENIALFDLLTGEDEKAQPILHRLYEKKHDAWGALHAAIYAGEHGDNKTRDAALKTFSGETDRGSRDAALATLADEEAHAFATGKAVGLDDVESEAQMGDYDNAIDANINYFAGRLYLLQGQNDLGIKCLKRAAGHNSYGASRALAVMYLRDHHIEVPKPGTAN